jgi:hypothetical protein
LGAHSSAIDDPGSCRYSSVSIDVPADAPTHTKRHSRVASIPSPPLTGSCGCGTVRFEISAPLIGAAYCHCTRCQKRTGTAMQASARVEPGSVVIITGEDCLRDWTLPDGLSKTFCGVCGSHLFARDLASGAIAIVRMAAIDGDPGVRPAAHQFVAYAAPWEDIRDDGLPRFEERLPA